jgi:tetratricopeptide (TPR) repeat protein
VKRALGAALLIALLAAGGATGRPAVLTADQMRTFGMEALTKGYADQALAIADALLARDPGDSAALVLRAQALRVLQRLPESEAAARAAWAHARDPGARYTAATSLAQALSLQGHRLTAQYWFRQAVQNAPSPAARVQARQDFDYVRGENPLSLQVDASIKPSDNVNGGARDPLFEFHGLPFVLSGDALALSGLSWGVGVQGSYKLAVTETDETALTFSGSLQGVVLSQAAKAQAPLARNGDYALEHVDIGLQRKTALAFGLVTGAVSAGHSWYGGADLSNNLTASVGLGRPVGAGYGNLALQVTRQNRLDRAISSSTEGQVDLDWTTKGPRGDRWQAGLSVARNISQDINVDHSEATLSLGWQARAPVAGLDLGAGVSLRGANYAASPYTADGRRDVRWTARVTGTVEAISYLGFSPVLSLEVARNVSTVSLYDTRSLGLGLSVQSRF